MKKSNNKKGFVLVFVAMILLILSIVIPSFYYLAFSNYNTAITDGKREQAYYNANSGIEYARAILENPNPSYACAPLDPSTWPSDSSIPAFQCFANNSGVLFQCFASYENGGTVQVSIALNTTGIGGYDITSTGSMDNITAVRRAHWAGGIIDSWHQ